MIKNKFRISRVQQKQFATACLTFGTVWVLGIVAQPVLAQNPDGSDPTTPVAGGTALPADVTPATPDTDIADPQDPTAPPAGVPGAAQTTPFQQPKAESLTSRTEVPALGNIPYIGRLFQNNGLSINGQSSEMAAKTRRILALREMLKLGLTADDIAKVLPLLRRLRDAESQPPANPEQALEDEYQALLRAKPGDPLPPSSAFKLQDAARFYREEQSNVWTDLTKQIGAKKANGLRELIGQNITALNWYNGNGSSGTAPRWAVTGGSPVTTYLPGTTTMQPGYAAPSGFSTATGVAPKPGSGPVEAFPASPDAKPGKRNRRGTRQADPLLAPATPVPDASPSGVSVAAPLEATRQDGAQERVANASTTVARPLASIAAPQVATGLSRTAGATQRSLLSGHVETIAPGQSPYTYITQFVTTPLNTRLTLSELIEVLEQKLAAMRGGRVSSRTQKTTLGGNIEPASQENANKDSAGSPVGVATTPAPGRR